MKKKLQNKIIILSQQVLIYGDNILKTAIFFDIISMASVTSLSLDIINKNIKYLLYIICSGISLANIFNITLLMNRMMQIWQRYRE